MVPQRFIGILSVIYLTCSGGIFSTISVRTTAGHKALHVMPVSAYSLPIVLVSPMTAALLAEYANMPALPSFPAIDEMLQILP